MLNLIRSQFILMIGDDGILAVPYGLDAEPFFTMHDDEKGRTFVLELLARHPNAPVFLFADMLAQDYRRETLPRLSFLDRPKLIKRRLQQAFPQSGLTAHFALKNRTQILLAGLHADSPLFDWLKRLKSRLPQICLVPVECADIITRLFPDGRNGWAMMLSRERTGGFRQIITHRGELIFTRLTPPLPETSTASEIAEALRRDITASLGYLARLGLTDAGQLRIALLMPDSVHDELAALSLPVHSITLISPRKLAEQLRLPFTPYATDPYADLVFAGWLTTKKRHLTSLRTPEIREAFWQKHIRTAGQRVAFAAMAFALVTIGLRASDLFYTLYEGHQETEQLINLKNELKATQATATPLTEPLGKLRQATASL